MATKLVGAVDKLIMQEGYPELTCEDLDSTQIEAKYICGPKGLLLLPKMYTTFDDKNYPFFLGWGVLLRTKKIKPISNVLYEVSLTYRLPDTSDGGGSSDGTVSSEVEMITQDVDVPIGQHPDYCVSWDHQLIGNIAELGQKWSVPSWAFDESLTSTVINDSADKDAAKKWRWLKAGEAVPEGWTVVLDQEPGFRGVTSFRSGVTTVTHTQRANSKNSLIKDANSDYTIQSPPEKFGKSGVWLRGGSSIRKSGRKWERVVAYTNAKSYNDKLYS